MGEEGQEICRLFERFESSDDKVSDFARQLDKYQAVKKPLSMKRKQAYLYLMSLEIMLKSILHIRFWLKE